MKRFSCWLPTILFLLLSTCAFADSTTIALSPNVAGDNFFFSQHGPGYRISVFGGTPYGYFDYRPPGYAPGTTLGGNVDLFFSEGFAILGSYSSELSSLSGTLFLSTFTLPTNGKNFTAFVGLGVQGSGILDNGEMISFGGGKRGKIIFDYTDGFYLPEDFVATPEPGTLMLLGSGVIGVLALARRRLRF